jgi:two-component system, NarL family, invasion response regulator UvrY
MANPIRIILVDDHKMMRESCRFLLEQDKRFNVIAECNNGVEAIEQAEKLLPDIILMDIHMSPVNGFEATRQITTIAPSVKIIGISTNNSLSYATRMVDSGAKGFVTKTSVFDELKIAIQKVYNGEIYICNEIKKMFPEE